MRRLEPYASAKPAQRQANIFEGFAKVLAAVGGDQDQAWRVFRFHSQALQQGCCLSIRRQPGDHLQGIDHRVAGHDNTLFRDAFTQQVLACPTGGGEVQVGDHAGNAAVDLFGEGLPFIAGAQAGFHVTETEPVVVSQQGSRHDRGGIALGQHPIRLDLLQNGIQAGEDRRRQIGQGLPGLHQVQVEVGLDGKQAQHLVEHLAVLGGDADQGFEPGRLRQAIHNRRHFYGFRTGADDRKNTDGHSRTPSNEIIISKQKNSFRGSMRKFLRPVVVLAIILCASALLRISVALVMGDQVEILPGIYDQLSYHGLAQNVLAGNGFSFDQDWWPVTRAGEPTAHWSYAMTLYLVAVYKIFGVHPLAARLIQAIATGILMPWLVYRLARRTFRFKQEVIVGDSTWEASQIIALLAAAWTAFYGYFIYYSAALMTETFYITCILWTLDVAQRIPEKTVEGSLKKRWALLYLKLGLAVGLAVLFRQAFLLFLPFLFAWLWWAQVRMQSGEPNLRRSWLPSKRLVWGGLATLAVVAVLILPFTAYNYTRFQRFVLLNTNSGYAFFWANHPVHGYKFVPLFTEGMPSYQELIPEELRSLDEAALDQELLRIGLGFVFDEPLRYISLSLTRIPEHFIFWPLQTSPLLSNLTRTGSLGVALPFSIAGIIFMSVHFRRNDFQYPAASILLLLFFFVYAGIHILTWAGIRYRLPVDPILILFASYGLFQLIVTVQKRFKLRNVRKQAR